MSKQITFKTDRFRKHRGGYSRWLSVSCEKCGTEILVYQKDGPGMLKRLYLDRIAFPNDFNGKRELVCKKCKTVLGVPMNYKKENRAAYRVFVGAITKRVVGEKELDKFMKLGLCP